MPGTKVIQCLEKSILWDKASLTAEDLKSSKAIAPAGIVLDGRYPQRP